MITTEKKIVWLGAPPRIFSGAKNEANFFKNYHFIVQTYFCEFSLPKYSAVSILGNHL